MGSGTCSRNSYFARVLRWFFVALALVSLSLVAVGGATGSSSSGEVYGDGFVVHADRIFHGHNSSLVVLEAESGRQLSEFRLGAHIDAGPILVDRLLFVATTDPRGPSCGRVMAIEADSGKVVWTREHRSCAIFPGERVIYLQVQGGNDVLALDAKTGKRVWMAPGNSFTPIHLATEYSGLLLTDNRLLNASNGQTVRVWPNGLVARSLAPFGQMVFLGTYAGELLGLEIPGGSIGWQLVFKEKPIIVEVAADQSRVYVAAYLGEALSAKDGDIRVFDVAGKAQVWQKRLRPSRSGLCAGPFALSDEKLYFVHSAETGTASEVVAVAAATETESWISRLEGDFCGPIAIAGGKIYLRGGNGTLISLSAHDGAVRWRFTPRNP